MISRSLPDTYHANNKQLITLSVLRVISCRAMWNAPVLYTPPSPTIRHLSQKAKSPGRKAQDKVEQGLTCLNQLPV